MQSYLGYTVYMSSKEAAPNFATRVVRVRVKDRHAAWLAERAREVNTIWNYCNELQMRVFERERKFLTGFDFWPYLKGCTRGETALKLPVQTVQETAEQFARSRRQHRKVRLRWRKSRGAQRSLGWLPFKVRTIKYEHGQIYYAGKWLSVWDSYGLGNFDLRAGSLSEDARGRWYLNVTVNVAKQELSPAIEDDAIGVDLGLKSLAVLSDARSVDAQQFYRDLEPSLAIAQRAGKKRRVNAIHAKISNRRKDHLHKLSTGLVRNHSAIFVGDVNAQALARTGMAKSVLDAGWSAFRTMLQYKCDDAGRWFSQVDEKFSTQECSACHAHAGPKGRKGLEVRTWTCPVCTTVHDRDVNAALNIKARGLAWLETQFAAAREARADESAVNKAGPRGPAAAGHGRPVVGIPVL